MSELYSAALANLGVSVQEFLELTPRELDDAIHHRNRTREAEMKAYLETMRLQTWWNVNKWLPSRKKINKKKMITFSWDTEPKQQSMQQMKAVMKAIAKAHSGKKQKERG